MQNSSAQGNPSDQNLNGNSVSSLFGGAGGMQASSSGNSQNSSQNNNGAPNPNQGQSWNQAQSQTGTVSQSQYPPVQNQANRSNYDFRQPDNQSSGATNSNPTPNPVVTQDSVSNTPPSQVQQPLVSQFTPQTATSSPASVTSKPDFQVSASPETVSPIQPVVQTPVQTPAQQPVATPEVPENAPAPFDPYVANGFDGNSEYAIPNGGFSESALKASKNADDMFAVKLDMTQPYEHHSVTEGAQIEPKTQNASPLSSQYPPSEVVKNEPIMAPANEPFVYPQNNSSIQGANPGEVVTNNPSSSIEKAPQSAVLPTDLAGETVPVMNPLPGNQVHQEPVNSNPVEENQEKIDVKPAEPGAGVSFATFIQKEANATETSITGTQQGTQESVGPQEPVKPSVEDTGQQPSQAVSAPESVENASGPTVTDKFAASSAQQGAQPSEQTIVKPEVSQPAPNPGIVIKDDDHKEMASVTAVDDSKSEDKDKSKGFVLWSLYGFLIAIIILTVLYVLLFRDKSGNDSAQNAESMANQQKVGGALSRPDGNQPTEPQPQPQAQKTVGPTEEQLAAAKEEVLGAKDEEPTVEEPEIKEITPIDKLFTQKEVADGLKVYASKETGTEFAVPSGWVSCLSDSYISTEEVLAFYDGENCPDVDSTDKPVMYLGTSEDPVRVTLKEGYEIADMQKDYSDSVLDLFTIDTGETGKEERALQARVKDKYLVILFPSGTTDSTLDEVASSFKVE